MFSSLPFELICMIMSNLSLADTYTLCCTSVGFRLLLVNPEFAKQTLESKAPNSLEAQTAKKTGFYIFELMRLIKRHGAVSSVHPLSFITIPDAKTWIYKNRVLCYYTRGLLVIRDTDKPSRGETGIDIGAFPHSNFPPGSNMMLDQILYQSGGILITTFIDTLNQGRDFVVFDLRSDRSLTLQQPRIRCSNVFARCSSDFLCIGMCETTHQFVQPVWYLKGYDIRARRWVGDWFGLPEQMGTEIGLTTCFEVFDGYLYAISTAPWWEGVSFDIPLFPPNQETHYTGIRIPFNREGFQRENMEAFAVPRAAPEADTARPDWPFVRMFRHEETGRLKIVEGRLDYRVKSSTRRTYYTRRAYYTSDIVVEDEHDRSDPSQMAVWMKEKINFSESNEVAGWLKRCPASSASPTVHIDDSPADFFTLNAPRVRAYFPECQTFIDVVNGSQTCDRSCLRNVDVDNRLGYNCYCPPRFCLRGASQRFLVDRELQDSGSTLPEDGEPPLDSQSLAHSKHQRIRFWPRELDVDKPYPQLDRFNQALSQSSFAAISRGEWDERSIAYSLSPTGPEGLEKLVFMSFDLCGHPTGVETIRRIVGDIVALASSRGKGREEKEITEGHPISTGVAGELAEAASGLGRVSITDGSPLNGAVD
ncbi:hypothetical protein B0T24DRAFT_424110 [Lasiosphaeria ovina]|uniref:F-box domain-containing protein n=1 Tax=Lasiosphaeria ovina TaxID=92902 RepID=A0AAE0N0N7_9PEZI|nr:hypothetical protein B0T24DRAFT_424110 [Lasiosphaeria ovina]